MNFRVLVIASDGSSVEAQALLDNASSASCVSNRLVLSLSLPHIHQNILVSGIAVLSPNLQFISNFQTSAAHHNGRKIDLTAAVLPMLTCDLPVCPAPFELTWEYVFRSTCTSG